MKTTKFNLPAVAFLLATITAFTSNDSATLARGKHPSTEVCTTGTLSEFAAKACSITNYYRRCDVTIVHNGFPTVVPAYSISSCYVELYYNQE